MSSLEELNRELSFQDANFSGLDLQNHDLSGKEFFNCTFKNTKLGESLWRRVLLEDCTFESCDLTRCKFAQTTLRDVTFLHSKLMGIDWSEVAKNPLFRFEQCDLRYASFVGTNLRKTVFRDCKVLEANFIECDLIESDFGGSDLSGANFEASDLTRATLRSAVGAFVNPAKNRVKGLRIDVESAALLALFHGMRVTGYSEEEPSEPAGPNRRSRKR
jgi:fluoroquinolone resistance protein